MPVPTPTLAPTALIVEDDPRIAEILQAYFERAGFRVLAARDGDEALRVAADAGPDIVLLDVSLPRRDGFEVLAALRARSAVPVIMVTAMDQEIEKLSALKMGADDYVVKPFSPLEVVARAQTVLRRTHAPRDVERRVRVAGLTLDAEAHLATMTGTDGRPAPLALTATEFRILAHMARSPARVFTRAELLAACLPADSDALERTVDSHVSKLRRKLVESGDPHWLPGVRAVGYRLRRERAEPTPP